MSTMERLDSFIRYIENLGGQIELSCDQWEGEYGDLDEGIVGPYTQYSYKPYDSDIGNIIGDILENEPYANRFFNSIFNLASTLSSRRYFSFFDLAFKPNALQIIHAFECNEVFTTLPLNGVTKRGSNFNDRGYIFHRSLVNAQYLKNFKLLWENDFSLQLLPHSMTVKSYPFRESTSRWNKEIEMKKQGYSDKEIADFFESASSIKHITAISPQVMIPDATFPDFVKSIPVLFPIISKAPLEDAKQIIIQNEAYIGRSIRKINSILADVRGENYHLEANELLPVVEKIINDEIKILSDKIESGISMWNGLRNAGVVSSSIPLTVSIVGFFTNADPSFFNLTESAVVAAGGTSLSEYIRQVRSTALENSVIDPEYKLIWSLQKSES